MPFHDSTYPSVLRGYDKRQSERLAAAAPDLLSALRRCEELCNDMFQETGDHEYMRASDAAREAIEKASDQRALRRIGLCVESRTSGCGCGPNITAYPSEDLGSDTFHDLTANVPINGTSCCRGQEGMCRCGAVVVYDQWLLVTGTEPAGQ